MINVEFKRAWPTWASLYVESDAQNQRGPAKVANENTYFDEEGNRYSRFILSVQIKNAQINNVWLLRLARQDDARRDTVLVRARPRRRGDRGEVLRT